MEIRRLTDEEVIQQIKEYVPPEKVDEAIRQYLIGRQPEHDSAARDQTLNIEDAGRVLTDACYGGSKASGWHTNPETGLPRTDAENKALFPIRIALCHSELSEALEGDRKNIMDDHLPHRPMAEVELADTVIRVFDLAGAMGFDIGGAIAEKLAYNSRRADHRLETRKSAGGKLY